MPVQIHSLLEMELQSMQNSAISRAEFCTFSIKKLSRCNRFLGVDIYILQNFKSWRIFFVFWVVKYLHLVIS